MKLLTRFLAVVILFVAAGCIVTPNTLPPTEIPEPGPQAQIGFQIIGVLTYFGHFEIRVRFSENTDFEGLIQEIYLDNDDVLVEYHKTPRGVMRLGSYDKHTAPTNGKYVRRMRLYPANVEGVDYRGNFAHLPQNRDGSVVTNIGWNFNAGYQWKKGPEGQPPHPQWGVNHETRGEVTDDLRETGSVWWSIYHDTGYLMITKPDGKTVVIGDTVITPKINIPSSYKIYGISRNKDPLARHGE